MTDANLPRRLEFLRSLGVDRIRHNSEEDLLPHLLGTRRLLRSWGARDELLDAGLFHSIYGTEFFTMEAVELDEGSEAERRAQVRSEIGDVAEGIVHAWCFGKRWSLEANLSRASGEMSMERRRVIADPGSCGVSFAITDAQMRDLVELWIADTLEQIDRVIWRELPTVRALVRFEAFASPAAFDSLQAEVARRVDEPESERGPTSPPRGITATSNE